jgi:hypothetical protein
MRRKAGFLLQAVLLTGSASAQMDMLTLREAESIVARIPEVAAAHMAGSCPALSPEYSRADQLDFQVRLNCGPRAGALLNNYTVSRRTGAVRLWGDAPLGVADRAGEEFAGRLVNQARGRILSPKEASCVALTAAKSLTDWGTANATISVEQSGTAQDGRLDFVATLRWLDRAAEAGRLLSVSLSTARVRDNQTGLDLASESLGALISKIGAVRSPGWLTAEDAISVASQIPALASRAHGECRLWSGGAFWPDETQVSVSCGGRMVEDAPVIGVNIETGQTTNVRTGEAIESPEVLRVARELLALRERRKATLHEEIETLCRKAGGGRDHP